MCQDYFFRVSVSKLLSHLDTDHETEDFVRIEAGEYSSHFIVNEEDFSKSIMWISDQLHFNDGYFYRECCRSKEGLWYIWVYILETESCKALDYICTISIKSSDGLDELSCRCRPLSLDMTKEKIAESGRGLVFTDTTARYKNFFIEVSPLLFISLTVCLFNTCKNYICRCKYALCWWYGDILP